MLDIVLCPFKGRLHFKEFIQFRFKLNQHNESGNKSSNFEKVLSLFYTVLAAY